MRRLLAIATTVLGLASCTVALAQDRQQASTLKIDIEGQTVAVPAPFGYCDLDPAQPRDRLLTTAFDRLWQDARVLRRMSPCEELESWRAGKTKAPIEVVLTLFDSHQRLADSEDRDVFLERVAPGEPMGKDSVIAEAGKGFRAGPKAGESVTIGLIDRTDRAAFHAEAILVPIDGEDRKLTVLAARTVVESTPLLIQVYSPYEDGTEIDWMFRDSQEHVDRVLSANGEPSRRFQSRPEPPPAPIPGDVRTRKTRMPRERTTDFFGNNGGYIALGMVIGGALLIGIGLVAARRLKPAP